MTNATPSWLLEFRHEQGEVCFRWSSDGEWRGGASASFSVDAACPEPTGASSIKRLRGDRVISLLVVLAHQRAYGTDPGSLCGALRGMPGWARDIQPRSVNPALQAWLGEGDALVSGRPQRVGLFDYWLDAKRHSAMRLRADVAVRLPEGLVAWLDAGASLVDAYARWGRGELPARVTAQDDRSIEEVLREYVGDDRLHWVFVQPPRGQPLSADHLDTLCARETIHAVAPRLQRTRYARFARWAHDRKGAPRLGGHEHGGTKRMFIDLEHGGFCYMRFARGGYLCAVVVRESRDALRQLLQLTQGLYDTLRSRFAPGDRDAIIPIV